jgi:hypothetical protein
MTREEIHELKNYDLDAEIAKALGWFGLHGGGGGISWGKCPELDYEDVIVPHYSGCLDMCQQAEATLTSKQWVKYAIRCDQVALPKLSEFFHEATEVLEKIYPEKSKNRLAEDSVFVAGIIRALHMQPRQRAESLLWVLTGDDEA